MTWQFTIMLIWLSVSHIQCKQTAKNLCPPNSSKHTRTHTHKHTKKRYFVCVFCTLSNARWCVVLHRMACYSLCMVSVHTQSNHPPVQTGRECIFISLYFERRHLFIVSQRWEQLPGICSAEIHAVYENRSIGGDEVQPDQESDRT